MNITDFKRLRLGSLDSCFMDVAAIGKHPRSQNGFVVTAYLIGSYKKGLPHMVEVRKKENQVALITYHISDAEIDQWWQDAEIMFSWTEGLD